ncbi:hypothetical protein [Kitasatospora aureofaciens]|nr:hypothetical protein [Kitasatospora aureofaciens]
MRLDLQRRLSEPHRIGFRSAEAVIALVMLCLGGNRPTLPRRQLA